MKNTKKVFAVLFAVVLTLCMAIPAFAAGNMITIENTVKGETYSFYKMMNLVVNGDAYKYTVTDEWKDFFQTNEAAKNCFTVDTNGIATAVNGLEDDSDAMKEFSKAASAYAQANNLTTVGTKTAANDNASVTMGNLADGYYLISSTLGTLAVVESTPADPEKIVYEKNEKPGLDKEVQEDSTSAWGDKNDADVGQTVDFKVTIAAKAGAKNYVMHDKMEKGLDFAADSVVIEGLTKGTDYTVVTEGLDDGCTFHIVFTQAYLDTIKADTSLVVTYSAVLTEDAIIDADGVQNDAKLTYGDNNETEWDTTKTKTYSFDLLKYNGADADKNPLAGAEFQLKRKGVNTVVRLVKIDENTYRLSNADDAEDVKVSSFITNDIGAIKIVGLDADSYVLTETKAPTGFNILVKDTEVIISSDTTETITVEVANNTGTELPSTGGIGTTIFYVVGAILVVGAAVILIVKKRVKATEA